MQTTRRVSSSRRGRVPSRRRPAARASPPRSREAPYFFDQDAADRAVDFFRRFLIHTKGEWAGRPFVLEPWESDEVIRPLFGWKRRVDGLRRYSDVYVYVPRKNGKSVLAAGVALYLLYCDGEAGAEIYSLAADRSQAAIVFNQAAEMVKASPELLGRTQVLKRSLFVQSTGSIYQVLSADVPTKHGLNPHGIVFDELHVQDDRNMWDTMRTGRGARRQPVTIAMTTAGYDKRTLCGEIHDKAVAVRDGLVDDPTFLPVIYGIEKKENWEDPKVWRRVNPNLGVTIQLRYLETEYKAAKESPGYQNTFRRLYLNEWVNQAVRWIDREKWEACAGPLPWEEMAAALEGRACYAGLDLSTTTDLSALVLLFDSSVAPGDPGYPTEAEAEGEPPLPGWEYGDPLPSYDVLPFFWCPEEGIRIRAKKDRVPYDTWRDAGALTATEGNAVDHGVIRKAINDLGRRFIIQEIGFDRYQAHKLVTELAEQDGFAMAAMAQGFGAMTAPTKALDVLYLRRQIRHGGHPVLAWNADNVSLDKDAYDNWKPSKKKSRERIDGVVALVMALSRAQVSTGTVEDARIEAL